MAMEFRFGKFGGGAEEKNEPVVENTASPADDLEVVELDADDSAIQSAKAAVEAMKNSSFFGQNKTGGDDLQPTTPVFGSLTEEQKAIEPVVTPGHLSMNDSVVDLKEALKPEEEASVKEETEEAATEEVTRPTSAAEAVALMNAGSFVQAQEGSAEEAPVEEEEAPLWKVNMDALGTELSSKSTEIEEAMTSQIDALQAALNAQIDALQEAVKAQVKAMQDSMGTQMQLEEDTVKAAIKEAGASTEQIVEAEKAKMVSAFELEKKTMNENFDQKMKEMQDKHDAEIRDLKEAHNQEVTQMKDDQINALDKMKQMYGEQMEEMQTAYREKNAALKREMDQYKEKLDILMLEKEPDPFGGAQPAAE